MADQTLNLGSLTSGAANGPTLTGSPATINLGAIPNAGRAFGPYTLVPAADPTSPRITAALYEADNATPVNDLEASFARRWQDPLSDTGKGDFTIPASEDDALDVDYLQIVRFSIGGIARFAALIEDIQRAQVAEGEEADQLVVASGRGHVAEWEGAVVWPENGTQDLPGDAGTEVAVQPWSDVRVFNWASPNFDDSGWGPVYNQSSSIPGSPIDWRPRVWPEPYSSWIWPTGQSSNMQPGDVYIRTTFELAAEADVAIFVSADNWFQLWLDGVTLIEGSGTEDAQDINWDTTFRAFVRLPAGTHYLSVKATNWELEGLDPDLILPPGSPLGNPAGVICSAFTTLADQRIDEILQTSNDPSTLPGLLDEWRGIAYPATVPGFTAGRILRILLEEAQDREVLEDWSLDFDDDVDSGGNAWPNISEVVVGVGDDYLKVLAQLAEAHIDFYAPPGGKVLQAWVKDYRGQDRSGDVTLENVGSDTDDNLTSATLKGTVG